MIRVKARYRNQKLELNEPIDLAEGAEVEVEIHPLTEDEGWRELGMSRLEAEWDNPEDEIYNQLRDAP